ncbi:BspA family leucine-rich repeat surface protein [Lacinutrix sp. MEBiC02595]
MKAKLLLLIMCLFVSYVVHAYKAIIPETNMETTLTTCDNMFCESSCLEDITSSYFITTWTTSGLGDYSITIPTIGTGYNYDVDWDNDGVFDAIGVTGDVTHDYGVAGEFIVTIRGDFPRIYFNNTGDRNRILAVEQWGAGSWTSMEKAFSGCSILRINALDNPDLRYVTNMDWMFFNATSFNQDISTWDVSNVTNMAYMFQGARSFNQDISAWDVRNVTTMMSMFAYAYLFNQDLSIWDVGNVTDMSLMFRSAHIFNQDLSTWNVSSVTDMSQMFAGTQAFNQDISAWDVRNVITMMSMFDSAIVFNQNLSTWDVGNVTDMSRMFSEAVVFNQEIGAWNVSNVTNMSVMFQRARAFNKDISTWDMSNVSNVLSMFLVAQAFNQDLSTWNVSNVVDMSRMFNGASSFNQDISTWDVSSVIRMNSMFSGASSFNQDLSDWDVSSVNYMISMFKNATSFNQDIGIWDISSVIYMTDMFEDTNLSITNYDNTLIGWNILDVGETQIPENIIFNGGNSNYCYGASARTNLIDTHGWTITDGGLDCSTLHINEEIFPGVSVYPNPVKSNVTITLQDDASYILNDMHGKVVEKGELFLGINTLNLEHISNGFYILKLKTDNHSTIKKIIKE